MKLARTMNHTATHSPLKKLALTVTALLSLTVTAEACTRVLFHGDNERNITARSMDWKRDVGTNLWILPQGIERNGEAGDRSIEWTAKYGSVAVRRSFD